MEKNTQVRIKATAIHLMFSLMVALSAIALIFFIWYPGALSEVLGGGKLFFLVVGCDVLIGPCLMFVVFNIAKPKMELVIDCSIIVALQLTALAYGMYIVSESRPVYVVFVKDRLEVATAIEFEPESFEDLTRETEHYRHFSWTGPRYVAVKFPSEREERNEMLLKTVMSGLDYQFFPRFYQPYEKAVDEIREAAEPVSELRLKDAKKQSALQAAVKTSGVNEDDIGWLLVRHRFGFCMALINKKTGFPIEYLLIDPIDDREPEKKTGKDANKEPEADRGTDKEPVKETERAFS